LLKNDTGFFTITFFDRPLHNRHTFLQAISCRQFVGRAKGVIPFSRWCSYRRSRCCCGIYFWLL